MNCRSRGDTGLQCGCDGELGLGAVPRVVHSARRRRLVYLQQTLGVARHLTRNCTHGTDTQLSQ